MRRGRGARRRGGAGYVVMLLSFIAACSGGSSGSGVAASPTATAVPPVVTPTVGLPTATRTHAPTVTRTVPVPTATSTLPVPTATHTLPPPSPPPAATNTLPPPTATNTLPPPTATATPLIGPIVTGFGIADGMGTFDPTTRTDEEGRPIFVRSSGSGFIIYVEGRPGPSGLPVGTARRNFRPGDPTSQPDLQIQASRDLGDGSAEVCDGSFPVGGGVPGIDPADFTPTEPVSAALNDFACRFKVFAEKDFACTQTSNGDLVFADTSTTVQFCVLVSEALTFSPGDTVLSVRLRDTVGNAGPAVQVVVRVN